jgi:hypothetical protein
MANITLSRVKDRMLDLAPVAGGAMLSVTISKFLSNLLNKPTVVNGLGAETTKTLKDFAVPVATTVIGAGISIGAENPMFKKIGNGIAVGGICDITSRLLWSKSITQSLSGGVMGSLLGDDEDLDGYDDEDLDGVDDDEDFGDIDDDIDGLGDIDDDEPAIAALDIPIPSGIKYQRYETPQERESIEGFNGELIL